MVLIDAEERALWKISDIKLKGRLQSILIAAYRRDFDLVEQRYDDLWERYEKINVGELNKRFPGRFPVEVIVRVRDELRDMRRVLRDYEGLIKKAEEIELASREFNTIRYKAYRITTPEKERENTDKIISIGPWYMLK